MDIEIEELADKLSRDKLACPVREALIRRGHNDLLVISSAAFIFNDQDNKYVVRRNILIQIRTCVSNRIREYALLNRYNS